MRDPEKKAEQNSAAETPQRVAFQHFDRRATLDGADYRRHEISRPRRAKADNSSPRLQTCRLGVVQRRLDRDVMESGRMTRWYDGLPLPDEPWPRP
jgi:hypothetical protein